MPDFAKRRIVMVDTQVRPSDVTSYPIIEAMLGVPRERFLPAGLREVAYVGQNLAVGAGRVVLEPRTLAKMLDALGLQPGDVVLDIGCGGGYSAAVIARLVEAVVAVEEDAGMAAEAEAALAAEGADNVVVMAGPLAAGDAGHGPYDAITVQGAADAVPEALLAQLREGGRIGCLFEEGGVGVCRIGHKIDGAVDWRYAFNAAAPILPGFAKAPVFAL